MSRLVFSKGRHVYSLDGRKVPSVSGVVNVLNKPALAPAAAKEVAAWAAVNAASLAERGEEAWRYEAAGSYRVAWSAKAKAGTAVHSIAQRLVFGEPVDPKDPDTGEPYPDDIVRMGGQVASFMDTWDVRQEDAVVESAVFHEEQGYAGTFDLMAVMRDGRRWLIDYKTGATGIYAETAYQLAGYKYATHIQAPRRDAAPHDLLMPEVHKTAALWVRPDFWELIPLETGPEVWEAFGHMLALKRHLDGHATRDAPYSDLVGAALPNPLAA